MKTYLNKSFLALTISVVLSAALSAQTLTPRPSPTSEVSQLIGVSKITIKYSRPAVNERAVWGGLVPFNQVWRTGANENTLISFSDDAVVEGKKIPAGTYGLHTIPGEKMWTIIFSKDTTLWGSMGYKEENDQLRAQVEPKMNEHTERLTFDFKEITDSSTVVSLEWGNLAVPFNVAFNTETLVMQKVNQKIDWRAPYSGADYILKNDLNYEEGLRLINISMNIAENYWNTRIKAQLLAKSGDASAAIKTMEEALALADKMNNPPFDLEAMKKIYESWK